MNETSFKYVKQHLHEDVTTLALRGSRDTDVDLPWALDQIQGWQTARKKLPSWAAVDGIVYPPHLSMEQCSSEQTALYKRVVAERLPLASPKTLIDLTGGFGVDFAFMATRFDKACYVEQEEQLCNGALHNFQLLGLDHARVIHDTAEQALDNMATSPASTLIYIDPARRDSNSARTYAIADCSPNVLNLMDKLFNAAHHLLIKLSPMLDWHKAVNDLGHRVAEVHIVSTGNECKELLVLMDIHHEGSPVIHCVNNNQSLIYEPSQDAALPVVAASGEGKFLYEPNASVMKAGCFGLLSQRYSLKAVSIDSHLFVSDEEVTDFPGRQFAVTAVTSMNKKELAITLKGVTRANVAVRNFPMSAVDLRKRLKVQDGGNTYIFGTTDASGQRQLYICTKQ